MKQYAPLIVAGLLVLSSAAYFFWPVPGSRDSVTISGGDAPKAPPLPAQPKGKLGLPKVTKLVNPMSCLSVEGDRYSGTEAPRFREAPREGVSVYNGCAQPVVIADVKTSDSSVAFAYSIFPSRAVVIQPRSREGARKDRLVVLSRNGKRCDEQADAAEDVCRFLPILPKQAVFFAAPYAHWFSLHFKAGEPLTGFLLEPVDPTAPPKPKTVPKTPDKGFKFKSATP